MKHRDQDNGPRRFIRNWLLFNEARPVPWRLVWTFTVTVLGLLLVSALLAALGRST